MAAALAGFQDNDMANKVMSGEYGLQVVWCVLHMSKVLDILKGGWYA